MGANEWGYVKKEKREMEREEKRDKRLRAGQGSSCCV